MYWGRKDEERVNAILAYVENTERHRVKARRAVTGFLSLVVLALLMWCASSLAAPVPTGPTLSVLVAGRPVAEHALAGTTYVEAAVGTEYVLKIVNPYDRRIGVELSVDGLNTIDAREQAGRLWILSPRETAEIPGWQVSGQTARKFVFAEERDSYARALGRATKTGVIRATFIEERNRYALLTPIAIWPTVTNTMPVAGSTATGSVTLSATTNTSAAATSLGTAQGARTDHVVTEVDFSRGAEIGTVEIHYVTREALAKILRQPIPNGYCPEVVGALR